MNSLIEILNQRGESFLHLAWPMLWQSSLLIAMLFVLDFLFRRKLRASLRYALWLVVLVKLCVPPTLALPTSPAWYLHKTPPPVVVKPTPHYTVSYDNGPWPEIPQTSLPAFAPPRPVMTYGAGLLSVSAIVSLALLVWLLVRWWQITRLVQLAATSERLTSVSNKAQRPIGMELKVQVKLTTNSMSPAVCGLFRPAILIPQSLAENFSDEQLRAVLLHELIHLRRRDVWLNFVQALLQIIYWWHPLVWLANARIRRVREEAVDDAVMLALREDAESYAPTLLEVAKLALNRPLASLGLVGIMESRHSLRQRIERLVDFRPPRQAGLTLASLLGILAFTAVAVPMGKAPDKPGDSSGLDGLQTLTVNVNPEIFLRNVKLQAVNYMHATNDDWVPILLDILRCEGVDGVLPDAFEFNLKAGEMTAKNSPDALEIFRQIIEQLNRPDGKGDLFLRNSSYHRSFHPTSVLIKAQFYAMRTADFKKVIGYADNVSYDPGNYLVAPIAAERFAEFNQKIKSLGLNPFSEPRIETGHGMTAELYTGAGTNGVHFDCLPYISAKGIELAFRANVIGDLSVDGTTLVGTANHAIKGRVMAQNHDGIIVCANNSDGTVKNNLVVVLEVQMVTNSPPVNAGGLGQIDPGIETNFGRTTVTGVLTDPNFRAVINALQQQTGNETLPEPEVTTRSGNHVNWIGTDNISAPLSQTDNSQLVQDAKLDYEMGKLDDAEKLLKFALSLDAQNNAAKYYLGLVQTARQHLMNNPIKTGRQKIVEKLERIQLDPFGPFMAMSLAEVVHQLNEMARQNDPEKIGVNIVILTNSFSDQPPAIDSVVINLTSPLMNIKLRDALDAIPMVADKPIMYSVMNNSIVFSMKDTSEIPTLYGRHFRVGNSSFVSALKKKTGLETNNVSQMASIYFSKIGVDLNVPGKSVFFNDGLGELFVRATSSDLDRIEQAIVEMHPDIPQIHIKAQFLEVSKESLALLRPFPELTNGVTILSAASFRKLLQTLESNPGAKTLAEPEVVTTSGRRTQMQATRTVIEEGDFVFDMVNIRPLPLEVGSYLNVAPYVLSDGYTINLTLIPSLTELLASSNSVPKSSPVFRIRQLVTTLNLWDGQTAIISGLPETDYVNGEEVFDKSKASDKELLVFVTVTLVDSDGIRIHLDEPSPADIYDPVERSATQTQ